MGKLKIYTIYFDPMWPVPSGLIILAKDKRQARKIAEETIKHTEVKEIKEIQSDKAGVIFYESGDY